MYTYCAIVLANSVLLLTNVNCTQVFITTTYDATTHFQTTCSDILDVYKRCTGEDVDFSKVQQDVTTVGEQ